MFEGFSPETIDFLWGIKLNNRRDWFLEHKQEYQKTLYEPLKALAQEVFEPFLDEPNMAYKVSRIYKDARMHPPVPYKEDMWLTMRPDQVHWSEQPALYFDISPMGYSFGFLLWRPKPEVLERWRKTVEASPDVFLKLVRKLERETGLKLEGEAYKRKKPCTVEALEPYFSLRNFSMGVEREPDERLFSPALAEEVRTLLQALLPLYRYFLNFTA